MYTFNYFGEQPEYDVSDLPDCYAKELAACADWLKFGFHAGDDKKKYNVDEPEQVKADYEKFLEAIMHATNHNPDCLDRVVRLGFFAGTEANVLALRDCEKGILGLLTADNDNKRLSYYFGEEKTAWVNRIGEFWEHGVLFLRSQLRMELVENVDALMEKMREYTEPKVIELFTHESCWCRKSRVEGFSVRQLCEELIRRSFEAGYGFGFAQELYYVEGGRGDYYAIVG